MPPIDVRPEALSVCVDLVLAVEVMYETERNEFVTDAARMAARRKCYAVAADARDQLGVTFDEWRERRLAAAKDNANA